MRWTRSGVCALLAASLPLAAVAAPSPIDALRRAAGRGDAAAGRQLGQAYESGTGVAVDLALAQRWYRRAAEAGDLEATSRYGRLLFASDRAAAMPWLTRAADKGDPRAAYILGTALFNGDGGRTDWPAAYAYMRLAADAGLGPARTSLARMTPLLTPAQVQDGRERAAAAAGGRSGPRAGSAGTGAGPAEMGAGPAEMAPAAPPGARVSPASARRDPVAHGPYYVQLGVFSTEARGRAVWSRIGPALRAAAGDRAPRFDKAGTVVRVRLTDLDRAGAGRLCRIARGRHADCMAGRAASGPETGARDRGGTGRR